MIVLVYNQDGDRSDSAPDENQLLSPEAQQWLQEAFPEFYAAVPSLDDRSIDLNIPNPFSKDSEARHPKLREKKSAMTEDGGVNGLIKFHMRSSDGSDRNAVGTRSSRFAQRQMAVHHRTNLVFRPNEGVHPLPPGFGRDGNLKLDVTDTKLLRFCKLF